MLLFAGPLQNALLTAMNRLAFPALMTNKTGREMMTVTTEWEGLYMSPNATEALVIYVRAEHRELYRWACSYRI